MLNFVLTNLTLTLVSFVSNNIQMALKHCITSIQFAWLNARKVFRRLKTTIAFTNPDLSCFISESLMKLVFPTLVVG